MEHVKVKERLEAAINLLFTQDRHLLEVCANERSITFRLGLHLQCLFKGWHVDCEYNRYGRVSKRVKRDDFGEEERLVLPDIIIHKRGAEGPNLLVIEAKPNPIMDNEDVKYDLFKLRRYKEDLSYKYAVLLEIYTGDRMWSPDILLGLGQPNSR